MSIVKINNLNYNFIIDKEQSESYFNAIIEKYIDKNFPFLNIEKDHNINNKTNQDVSFENNENSEESDNKEKENKFIKYKLNNS